MTFRSKWNQQNTPQACLGDCWFQEILYFRKTSIIEWKKKAFIFVGESENVLKQAKVVKKHGLKAKDALHIACAIETECDYFITTDDEILNKGSSISQIEIVSPVDMITIMEE